ncbi:MAG: DUF4202 domain-containing protein [Chthoniobacterales bacterium]
MNYGTRFSEAIRRFDQENGRDPNLVVVDGVAHPHELLYAKRLTDWVVRLHPQASEALLLAARCQHICRWMMPRSSYEMTRSGYLRWRNDLKRFHAKKSAEILREVGYAEEVVGRVQDLNLKKQLGHDLECQVLEDALCLVTLQYQLADLSSKTDHDKMVSILQKTWKKMSPAAREHALALPYPEEAKKLLQQALAPIARETR